MWTRIQEKLCWQDTWKDTSTTKNDDKRVDGVLSNSHCNVPSTSTNDLRKTTYCPQARWRRGLTCSWSVGWAAGPRPPPSPGSGTASSSPQTRTSPSGPSEAGIAAPTGIGAYILRLPYYTVKKVSVFPVPSRDVTYQTLPGRDNLNFSRPGRVW